MARRRYRRYRRRRSRWSPNITNILTNIETLAGQPFSGIVELATNPAQNTQTVSQTYTVKNIELTFQLETTASTGWSTLENATGYIMYVPQGMTINADYPSYHPEYIMAYRFIGTPENESTAAASGVRNPLRIRSRLARKLNTGDQIVFFIVGVNQGTANLALDVHGVVRWWTKAN